MSTPGSLGIPLLFALTALATVARAGTPVLGSAAPQGQEPQRPEATAPRATVPSPPASTTPPAPTSPTGAAAPAALQSPPSPQSAAAASDAANGPLRLFELGLHVLGAVGGSTERGESLRQLQGGAHDPRARGFTLQQAHLSLHGAIDPWLEGEAAIVFALDPEDGETLVELEEAFLITTQLPAGLQAKAGAYFTEFGLLNATHPHAWDWIDQPVMHTRVFGGDGMRGPGARLAWRAPAEHGLEVIVGAQNANGETMPSFLASEEVYDDRPIGGRSFAAPEVRSAGDLLWSLRVATVFELGETTALGLGASAAVGPNATGDDADTVIWGADFALRWDREAGSRGAAPASGHTHAHGDPHGGSHRPAFVRVQGELLARAFDAAAQVDASDPLAPVALPEATLDDYGGYLQGLWGFSDQWAAGMRVDWASGAGDSYLGGGAFGRAGDPFRDDRVRLSPLLMWEPSERASLRLQYNWDDCDHLSGDAHSVWLGFTVLLGSHRPHQRRP